MRHEDSVIFGTPPTAPELVEGGDAARMSADELAAPLLEMLKQRFGASVVYAASPRYLADGVTARAFSLRLADGPPDLAGDLVCRVFYPDAGASPPDQILVEEALHNALDHFGFPVPRVLMASEADCAIGCPFMLMERVSGRDIFLPVVACLVLGVLMGPVLSWIPLALFSLAYWGFVGQLLMRLHAIPGDSVIERMKGSGIAESRLSARGLVEFLEERIKAVKLDALIPTVRWLSEQCPPPPACPTVCHGDMWLGNIMIGRGGTRVLDWTQAGIADPELDLGWIGIQRFSRLPQALPVPERAVEIGCTLLAPILWSLFSGSGFVYRLFKPVDARRLRFYIVFHSLRVLTNIATLYRRTPDETDPVSPELLAWGSRQTIRQLTRQIARITGFRVDVEWVMHSALTR